MNEDSALSKSEVRGRRNTNTKTVKRVSHQFDDEKELKGPHKSHSNMYRITDESLEDLDGFYVDVDWKKLIK